MKTKHTTGPWIIDGKNGRYTIITGDSDRYVDIATVNQYQEQTDMTAEANANLMAAAPIMFDALRAVENTLLDAIGIDSTKNTLSPATLLDLVQNAIQKATP